MSELQTAISGALVGGLFALMAVGLTLTWGMLRVINLAHFAMILLSAYLTYELATTLRLDPLVTIVVSAPLMFLAAVALQWLFQVTRISEFNSLLVSFGLLIVIIQLITNYWSADFRRMDVVVNPYALQSVALGPFRFPTPTLMALIAGVGIVALGYYLLEKTYPGRALRAFAQDPEIAAAYGIDHRRLSMLLSGFAGATGAVAGMLYAVANPLTPDRAFEWIGTVFAIVIIGGIGNLVGTLVAGALVLMTAALVAFWWSPTVASLAVFGAIVVTLILRPQGLFARRGS